MTKSQNTTKKRICQSPGCNEKHHANGYCSKHNMQFFTHGKIGRTKYDPNRFIIEENICRILLYDTNGKEKSEAIIDVEDYEKVKNFKWCLDAYGRVVSSTNYNHAKLHHVVLGFKYKCCKEQIDHINMNRKDNRKSNLRICNQSQNGCNRGKQKNNSSGYKGVFWDRSRRKWMASIQTNGKQKYLGRYESKIDAAKAYNQGAIKYHGEFANLNNI